MIKATERNFTAQAGTVLEMNVYDKDGHFLLEMGAPLTESCIRRILAVGYINVYSRKREPSEGHPPEASKASAHAPPLTTTQKPRFQAFNKAYVEKKNDAAKLIHDISNGGIVDVEAIAAQTESIMSELNDKKDLIGYLTFMEGTDDVTYGHSINVSLLSNLFGQWIGLSADEMKVLTVAGMLHDVGKTQIPAEIINKTGKLTDEEFKIMKSHPKLGYDILTTRKLDKEIQFAALMHHEKLDGSGYPLRLTADKITRFASIVAICDIYDAMTANRSYRPKICPFTIFETFENKFYGELHTEYLLVFLDKIAHSFMNNLVKLSNNEVGEVIHVHPKSISRPIIRLDNGTFVDLQTDKSLSVAEVY
ncbi:MAG: HD-GYP domain-containing protein [Defluviitaleaceae bacterium]|nr:HD-GYP domain-containing protein [Defluviitaleaceae bacterium]